MRVTRGLIRIAQSVQALAPKQPAEALLGQMADALGERLASPLATLASQQLEQTTQAARAQQQLATALAALGELASRLKDGNTAAQKDLRASLKASAEALHALQASTQTLHQHSDRAQEQRMVDALLSLSVTYRQLILPLVRAIEARVGEDAQLRQQIQQLEGEFERLGKPGRLG